MRTDETRYRRHFMRGVILVFAVQLVFMGGGLLVERLLDVPVTGVPSMIGLSLVLVLASMMSRRASDYVLLGSFTLAFLAPVTLFLVVLFRVFPVTERLAFFSLGYMSALVLAVWFYFGFRIWAGTYAADDEP